MTDVVADESSLLLPQSSASIKDGDVPFSIWRDLAGLTRQTIPICLSFALQNAVQAISALTAGRLGSFELEVTSFGFMFFSCTGTMVAIGGATALDTLCAQAFASHKVTGNGKILGLLLQQCLLVLLGIFSLLIAPIWVFSDRIFVSLGQQHDFAIATGRFMLFMLPSGMLQVVAECLKKYLQVQGESSIVGSLTAATSAVGVLLNFVLVRWTRLRLWGVPCAFCIYQLLTVVALLSVIAYKPATRETWRRPTVGALKGLSRLLWYAVTGILTIATEWWSFEILAMMAARLDSSSIGAQSILMSSDLLFTTVSLGISVATSHRVGGLLGAGKGQEARKAIATPYLLSFIIGAIEFFGIMLVRNHYGRIFTSDPAVIRKTAQVLPLMAGFQVLDLSNGGAGGILRGAGKNHLSGACNFLAYYGVGLTSAWFLCFRKDYGVFGLWAGIITGSGALLVLQSCCIASIRWKQLAKDISGSRAT
ncbi:ethionine resistance protein [Exophiala xenobiotica]|nr:ethionine resistance protein [Exophiala xenobiotica]